MVRSIIPLSTRIEKTRFTLEDIFSTLGVDFSLVSCYLNTIMSATQTVTQNELEGYDAEQVRLMEERCILVNDKDEAYGEGSKKQCEYSRATSTGGG